MRRRTAFCAPLVALLLLLAACARQGAGEAPQTAPPTPAGTTPTPTPGTTAQPEAPGECRLGVDSVKIGVQGIMSGSHADYGRQMEMGSTLAAEEINDQGGIMGCPIELAFRDTELNPDVAIQNARFFVDEFGAHFLVGIDSSGVALGLAPVIPELGRPLVVTHAATEKLTEVEVFQNGNEHVFRMSVPVYQDAIVPALIFAEMPELTRFATIGADYEYGHTAWEMFQAELGERRDDVEFVAEAWAPFRTADFTPHISTVMAAQPDVVFATPWAGEAVALLRQAVSQGAFEQLGVWWQAMGGSVDVLEGIANDLQNDAFGGRLWGTGRYVYNWPETDRNREFVEDFRQRWRRFPNYSAQTTYSAIQAIAMAVEEVGDLDDTDGLIGALEGLRLEAPAGEITVRPEDHQAVYNVPAGRIVFDSEAGIGCVCEDLRIFEAEEYYRHPPFEE